MPASQDTQTSPALPATRVAMEAGPVVATLQAARAKLDEATTPGDVQTVRANLDVLRAVLLAALRDPKTTPEEVADARRQLEELALDAAVKLGSMVPVEGQSGARTDLGSTSATVAEVAKRCGLSRDTLRRYRDLAAAYTTKGVEFMAIAKDAIAAGKDLPFGRLIDLLPKPTQPKKDDPPAPHHPGARPNVPGALSGGRPASQSLDRVFSAAADARAALDAPPAAADEPGPTEEPDALYSIDEECLAIAREAEAAVHVIDGLVRRALLVEITREIPKTVIGGRVHDIPWAAPLGQAQSLMSAGQKALVPMRAAVPLWRQVARMDAEGVATQRAHNAEAERKRAKALKPAKRGA